MNVTQNCIQLYHNHYMNLDVILLIVSLCIARKLVMNLSACSIWRNRIGMVITTLTWKVEKTWGTFIPVTGPSTTGGVQSRSPVEATTPIAVSGPLVWTWPPVLR